MWNIAVFYYEGKTLWSLEEYRRRSKEGIERLVNLVSLSYNAMPLLPYSDETFSGYQSASAQKTRCEIGQQIQSDIIHRLKPVGLGWLPIIFHVFTSSLVSVHFPNLLF